jgi:hypothetical protein
MPIENRAFKRVAAERDVRPEADANTLTFESSGAGVTNFIQNYLNKEKLPSELVKLDLLRDLNRIFQPDGTFSDIIVQQLETGQWEVFLDEERKGRVALSHSGSGIKTVLIVLALVHLVPHFEKRKLEGNYICAFQELENNLHPALLRRLLAFLADLATQNDVPIFLTTHSSATIDLFARNDHAQIVHVTHDKHKGAAKRVVTYFDNNGVLDDLDVRASDLLQANAILWVEGPSDRLYVNRWIDLFSNGQIKEGNHYQCVWYGGRLLSHLSADSPDLPTDDVLSVLRTNRHAILLIDSDKSRPNAPMNETKRRMRDEVKKIGGISWVTKGREIENYISPRILSSHLGKEVQPQKDPFEPFPKFLDRIEKGLGKRFSRRKFLFAEQICSLTTADDLSVLDLSDRIREVTKRIGDWNA